MDLSGITQAQAGLGLLEAPERTVSSLYQLPEVPRP